MALHFAYTNDTEKAELLNNYFASTYVKTMEHCRHLIIKRIPAGAEFDNALDNVLRVMRKLNSNKSSGPDGFLTDLFKRSASRLVLPLSILFVTVIRVHLSTTLLFLDIGRPHIVGARHRSRPNC